MDEIIQEVVQRTRIPEDKARRAVQIVFEQLESRLPDPIASQLRSLAGGQQEKGGVQQAAGRIGKALDM